ncbi:glycosyltransferase [Ornithobacterium rhinotracheale]
MGGTEKALLAFINAIDKKKYHTTLILKEKGGLLYEQIPEEVEVITLDKYNEQIDLVNKNSPKNVIYHLLKSKKLYQVLIFTIYYLTSKIFNRWDLLLKFSTSKIDIDGYYDLAICYTGPSSLFSYICLNKINAPYKIQWIHSDVSKTFNDLGFGKRYYKKFSQIICVSKAALKRFKEKYPECKNVKVLYNVIDYEAIYKLSKIGETFAKDIEGLKILTVGRLSHEKGIDLIPEIANILKEKDIKFCWYIVGDGELRELLENKIEEYSLNENLILVGSKENPYTFFKDCELYIQPSRYEGYGISVAEAKFFNKRIILTNFASAQELANNYPNIEITNFSAKEIAEKIMHN